jgi:ankyrin repeat protein
MAEGPIPCTSRLEALHTELLFQIGQYLPQSDLSSLARTSRTCYERLNPELYRADAREDRSSAMVWGAREGELETLKLSLRNGGDVNTIGPGHFCFVSSNLRGCHRAERVPSFPGWLPDYSRISAPVLAPDDFATPLHWAAAGGHDDVLAWLLQSGAKMSFMGTEGCLQNTLRMSRQIHPNLFWSPLHYALCSNQLATAMEIIKRAPDWSHQVGHSSLDGDASKPRSGAFFDDESDGGAGFVTALHTAAGLGFHSMVSYLLENTAAQVNETDHKGNTAMHLAMNPNLAWAHLEGGRHYNTRCLEDKRVTIGALVAHGANLEATRLDGHTPFDHAVEKHCWEGATELLRLGANLTPKPHRNGEYLSDAITSCQHESFEVLSAFMKWILDSGADINGTCAENSEWGRIQTPLTHAVYTAISLQQYASVSPIELCLEMGADPNVEDEDGMTPLEDCLRRLHKEIQEDFLPGSVSQASRHMTFEAVLIELLQAGADPNQRTRCGKTPMELAKSLPGSRAYVVRIVLLMDWHTRRDVLSVELIKANREWCKEVLKAELEENK